MLSLCVQPYHACGSFLSCKTYTTIERVLWRAATCCAVACLVKSCRMGDASLAAFLRKTFSERSQQLLSGSLKAPDGAALQRVISKLDEEEKTCECCCCCCCCVSLCRCFNSCSVVAGVGLSEVVVCAEVSAPYMFR